MCFFSFKDKKLSTGIYYLNQSTKFKHKLTWSCPKTIIKTPPSNVGWQSVFVITCWTCWKGKFWKKRQRKLSTVWPTLARNQDFLLIIISCMTWWISYSNMITKEALQIFNHTNEEHVIEINTLTIFAVFYTRYAFKKLSLIQFFIT